MWRTGKRLYGNASDLVTMIKTLSGVSLGSDFCNRAASGKRTVKPPPRRRSSVTWLPAPSYDRNQRSGVCRHPIACASNFRGDAEFRSGAGNNTRAEHRLAFRHASGTEQCTGGENTVDLPTWEELTDIRDILNTAIDKELSRTTSDALFWRCAGESRSECGYQHAP